MADQCGVVVGFEGGRGIRIDDFWKKSVNCESTTTSIDFTHPSGSLDSSEWMDGQADQ